MNATKTKRTAAAGKPPRTYATLLAMYAPRVLHTAEEAAAAAEVLARLGGRELNADQTDYAALLTKLYGDWQVAHAARRPKLTQSQIVRAIMDEHEMTQAAMAEVVGITQGHLSLILKGDRALSKESIRRFCDRFAIGVDAML